MVAFNRLTKLCFMKGILNSLARKQTHFFSQRLVCSKVIDFNCIAFVLCFQMQITQEMGWRKDPDTPVNFITLGYYIYFTEGDFFLLKLRD